jgi:hypothetical protein
MAFEWLVKLNDMMSDPAAKAAASLKLLRNEIKELQAQQKLTSTTRTGVLDALRADIAETQSRILRAPNKVIRSVFQKDLRDMTITYKQALADQLREEVPIRVALSTAQARLLRDTVKFDEANNKATKSTGMLGDKMREVRKWARDWLMILYPLARAVGYLAGKAENLGDAIRDAINVKEQSMLGMNTAFGDKAKDMFESVKQLAMRSGRDIGTLMKEAMEFGNIGAPADLIEPIIAAISDAQAMGLKAEKLKTSFEEMVSQPVLQLRAVQYQLAGVVDETKFWAHLAKDIGVSIGDVNKLVEQHRVSGLAGALALLETMQEREKGGLGKVTFERADHTLQGTLDRFEQRMKSILMSIGDTPGFKVFKQALDNVLMVISGKKFEKTVDDLASKIGMLFEPLTGSEGRKRIEDFFERVKILVEGVLPSVSALGRGIEFLMKRFAPTVAERQKALEASKKLGMQTYMLGGHKVSAEEYFGFPATVETVENRKRLEQDAYIEKALDFGRGMAMHDRFYQGAEISSSVPDPTPRKSNVQFKTITVPVQVDIHGHVDKDDAEHIGKTIQESVSTGLADTLQQLNQEEP